MSVLQSVIDAKTSEIIATVKGEVSGMYTKYMLDLVAVCNLYSVTLLEGNFSDDQISGAITKENDSWSIVVNRNHAQSRKRFTIAHELGHYFAFKYNSIIAVDYMERNGNTIKDTIILNRKEKTEDIVYQAERQANLIAASILMPDDMVLNIYEQKMELSEMSQLFGVSESAMSYRLKSLGLPLLETEYL